MAKIYDQLRKAIKASDKTRYRLWRETGIDQALLVRFMAGKSGLSIESIEKIADSLNLDIIIKPKSKMRKVTR